MKKLLAMLSGVLVVGMFVTGCNRSTNGPEDENPPVGVTNEQTARANLATNDAFVQNDIQAIADAEVNATDYGTFGQIESEITPLRWGRFIQNVNISVTRDSVLPGDSIAIVHVHKVITGTLKIKAVTQVNDTVTIEKPFVDQSDRNIIFKRFARNTRRYWLNWLPVGISLVAGETISPNNINVTKLEVMTALDTITITDPLDFYFRFPWRRIASIGRRDLSDYVGDARVTVRATVVSTSPDTDLVALRFGSDGFYHHRRLRMHCTSRTQVGNLYEGVFEAQAIMHVFPGSFHLAVDALTRETLFDDQAPYSVSWWGFPYRVL
jgi:hypothetical protein